MFTETYYAPPVTIKRVDVTLQIGRRIQAHFRAYPGGSTLVSRIPEEKKTAHRRQSRKLLDSKCKLNSIRDSSKF